MFQIHRDFRSVRSQNRPDLSLTRKMMTGCMSFLRKRQFNYKPEWRIKWHVLPRHYTTWEREQDIRHVSHRKVLIADFKRQQREVKSGRM